jgi:site-specific DNA-methyltransferase (adenine-specific)
MNKLFNCDFRKVINEVNFDIILTDPPYNIGFKGYDEYSDNLSEEQYTDMLSELRGKRAVLIQYPEETMRYLVPALGIPQEVMVWCYNSNIPRQSRLISFYNIIPDFNRVRLPYKNPSDRRVAQLIASGSKGRKIYDWFDDIQMVKNVSKEKKHPCPVPIKLMERIITLTTGDGDTVFDPFMGSGTTGVACKNLGRNFVGSEISTQYYNIAKNLL